MVQNVNDVLAELIEYERKDENMKLTDNEKYWLFLITMDMILKDPTTSTQEKVDTIVREVNEIRKLPHTELEVAVKELIYYVEEHGKVLMSHRQFGKLVAYVHEVLNDRPSWMRT